MSSTARRRQQRVPVTPPGRHRAAARLVLLLGLGRDPRSGALDDRVGHHRRRRRPLRGGCQGGTDGRRLHHAIDRRSVRSRRYVRETLRTWTQTDAEIAYGGHYMAAIDCLLTASSPRTTGCAKARARVSPTCSSRRQPNVRRRGNGAKRGPRGVCRVFRAARLQRSPVSITSTASGVASRRMNGTPPGSV